MLDLRLRCNSAFLKDSLAGTTSVAEEKISNIRTVKAFSHEKQEIEKYDQKLNYVLGLQSKEALARGVFFGLVCILNFIDRCYLC